LIIGIPPIVVGLYEGLEFLLGVSLLMIICDILFYIAILKFIADYRIIDELLLHLRRWEVLKRPKKHLRQENWE
jgi:hypothetical protein